MPARKRKVSSGIAITADERKHLRRLPNGWVPKHGFTREVAWDRALEEGGAAVAYQCCVCSEWHVGHMAPAGAAKRRAAELAERAIAASKKAARRRRAVDSKGYAQRSTDAARERHHRAQLELRIIDARWLDDGGALHAGLDHER